VTWQGLFRLLTLEINKFACIIFQKSCVGQSLLSELKG